MKKITISILLYLSMLLILNACDDDFFEKNEFEEMTSEHGEDESHENGKNCMSCHYTEGDGEGWFSLAGTVYADDYDKFNHAKIVLEDQQSNVLKIVEVDELGNFYTTDEINFAKGLKVSIDFNGKIIPMNSSLYVGQCNLCHGDGEEKLILK